jgi:hypothetical protein
MEHLTMEDIAAMSHNLGGQPQAALTGARMSQGRFALRRGGLAREQADQGCLGQVVTQSRSP